MIFIIKLMKKRWELFQDRDDYAITRDYDRKSGVLCQAESYSVKDSVRT